MKTIKLTRGEVTLVDYSDFDWLNKWKWWLLVDSNGKKYAARAEGTRKFGTERTILMHRQILGLPKSIQGDHMDGDGLNNQRRNIRRATQTQNARNAKLRKDNTTGFKGVSVHPDGKFRAAIGGRKTLKHLGLFETAEAAALAYNNAALALFGEFANLNPL